MASLSTLAGPRSLSIAPGGHVVYPISADSGKVGKISASEVRKRWKLVADAVGSAAPEIVAPGTPLADYVTHNTRTP